MTNKDLKINKQIRAKEVRLIDNAGNQKGVVGFFDALKEAEAIGLDLVEISPNAKPPVCKILDFGKYCYEQEKKNRESKKKQSVIKVKEIRMQPKIDKHDLNFKTNHIKDFLSDGSKVKITVRFRGRELAHTELGKVVLDKILDLLNEEEVQYNIDKPATMEGKTMSMMISPKLKK